MFTGSTYAPGLIGVSNAVRLVVSSTATLLALFEESLRKELLAEFGARYIFPPNRATLYYIENKDLGPISCHVY